MTVNARYRKVRRLQSRHYRRGHTVFCRCPEPFQSAVADLRRRLDSGRPLPRRTITLPKETTR